jgi:hypothetical protein
VEHSEGCAEKEKKQHINLLSKQPPFVKSEKESDEGGISSCFTKKTNLPKLTKAHSKIADIHIRKPSNERKLIVLFVG